MERTFDQIIPKCQDAIIEAIKKAIGKGSFVSEVKGLKGSLSELFIAPACNKVLLGTDYKVMSFKDIEEEMKIKSMSFYKDIFNWSFDEFKKAVDSSTGTVVSKADLFLVNTLTSDVVDAFGLKTSTPEDRARIMINNDADCDLNIHLNEKKSQSILSKKEIIVPKSLFAVLFDCEANETNCDKKICLYFYPKTDVTQTIKMFEDSCDGFYENVGSSKNISYKPYKLTKKGIQNKRPGCVLTSIVTGSGKSSFARGVTADSKSFKQVFANYIICSYSFNHENLMSEEHQKRMNGEY